jgi:hypothetical protein
MGGLRDRSRATDLHGAATGEQRPRAPADLYRTDTEHYSEPRDELENRTRQAAMRNQRRTFRSALRAVRLHRDVGVQVVQRAVGLLAAVPAALVHALDLLVASARALVLLRTGDGDERVDLRAG